MNERKLSRPSCAILIAVAVVGLLAVDGTRPACAQSSQTFTLAAQQAGFINRVFKDAAGEHKYVLFVPYNYTADKKWPAILYLHGAGERGTDGVAPTTVGLGPYVRARAASFPFLVVFPQCEDTHGQILTSWSPNAPDGKRALAIFDSVAREFSVDPQHRVLTGWSMGGYGTWSLGAAQPARWSALIPIAGGGDPAVAARLAQVPIWAFHGADDLIVRPEESRRMIEAVRTAGGRPNYTEIPGAGHDVWQRVYSNDRLYEWMLSPQSAVSSPGIDLPARTSGATANFPGSRTRSSATVSGIRPRSQPDMQDAFVPAIAIPDALAVRLGNDALKAIAHSAPRLIPPEAFTGAINDIATSTESSGYTFNVQFSRIGYSFQLVRVAIKAYDADRVNVQLALRNVRLTIGSTYLQGEGRSAVAGPISIFIGYRAPVWLSFDVTPYVENNRLRLQLVGSRFQIPNDNWYVTPPYGISTRGLGMTEERVRSGLIEGIYGQKNRIEQEAVAIVPSLLARLEQSLNLPEVTQAANALWPLPVYRPRLQAWPERVQVDENGVSLVMGVMAGAIDPRKAPKKMRVERPAGVVLDSIPHNTDLQLGVAPGILEPLTQMLIQEDMARVNVLDIPGKAFAPFADRKSLAEILPDLDAVPKETEVSAELILASPISVRDAKTESKAGIASRERFGKSDKIVRQTALKPTANESSLSSGIQPAAPESDAGGSDATKGRHPFVFTIPKVLIAIATKENAQATEWKPYANLEVEMTQQATVTMVRRAFSERLLELDWTGEPVVKASAHFAAGISPKNAEIRTAKLRELFVTAWKGWTGKGPASRFPVPDVDFHFSKLRMDGVEWSPPVLSVRFGDPGVKLTNSSNVDLVYETKGAYSDWSRPITLKAGKSHEFASSDPLLFRRKVGDDLVQMYTLPAGTHCEFRSIPPGAPPAVFRVREPGMSPDAR